MLSSTLQRKELSHMKTPAERLDREFEQNTANETADQLETLAAYYRHLALSGRDHAEERRLRFVALQLVRTLVEEWV